MEIRRDAAEPYQSISLFQAKSTSGARADDPAGEGYSGRMGYFKLGTAPVSFVEFVSSFVSESLGLSTKSRESILRLWAANVDANH